MERIPHQKQRQDLAKAVGFWGHDSHHNSELDDKTGIPCDDISTRTLINALLTNRKSNVLNELWCLIHKSLFGEAAAKSDRALSGVVS